MSKDRKNILIPGDSLFQLQPLPPTRVNDHSNSTYMRGFRMPTLD